MCTNTGRMYKTPEGGRASPSVQNINHSAMAKPFCLNRDKLDDVKIQILEHILRPPLLKSTTKYRKKGNFTGYIS